MTDNIKKVRPDSFRKYAVFAFVVSAMFLASAIGIHAEEPAGDAPARPDLGELLKAANLNYDIVGEANMQVYLVPFKPKHATGLPENFVWTIRVSYNNDKGTWVRVACTLLNRPNQYVFNKKLMEEALQYNQTYAGAKMQFDKAYGDIDLGYEIPVKFLTSEYLAHMVVETASAVDDNYERFNTLDEQFPGE
ncbi:MAG: hypothetical protein NUW37_01350 [Planctomycetes bacterium]|nr:hypothetical protein [Planctomycetota bacterium]